MALDSFKKADAADQAKAKDELAHMQKEFTEA